MTNDAPPPIEGDWQRAPLGNTGAWSVGEVWIDRTRHRYGMWIAPRHCNAFGMMHGGAMATFADAQITAVREYSDDPAAHTPTISLSVDYLAPAPAGTWLMLDGTELRATRTMIFAQALITADGAPVARSSAIYRNTRNEGSRS